MKTAVILAMGMCLAGAAGAPAANAAEDEVLTTVSASANGDYVRPRRPDGSFRPETYVFGQGEYTSGQMRDESIDRFPFPRLAGLLVPYLARQNYVPTKSPEETDLLIVVHWGTTVPADQGFYRFALDGLQGAIRSGQTFGAAPDPSSPQRTLPQQPGEDLTSYLMTLNLANWLRDKANAHNAALLGYMPEMGRLDESMRIGGLGTYYHDLLSDVEEDRYFVILAAYDFQAAWKHKQRKLLWVTRVSMRAHGNRFDEGLNAMIQSASRYFGQASPGLLRRRVPAGRVDVGEPKVIGVVPETGK